MTARFDREAAELAVWYHYNIKRIPKDNLTKRLEFLEVTCDACIKLLVETAISMKKLEGRNMLDRLWLPPGVVHRRTPLAELAQEGDPFAEEIENGHSKG